MITKLEEFKVLGDHRGQLIALESNKQIPFDVKRVFLILAVSAIPWLMLFN